MDSDIRCGDCEVFRDRSGRRIPGLVQIFESDRINTGWNVSPARDFRNHGRQRGEFGIKAEPVRPIGLKETREAESPRGRAREDEFESAGRRHFGQGKANRNQTADD